MEQWRRSARAQRNVPTFSSGYAALRKLRPMSLFPSFRGRAPAHAQVKFVRRVPSQEAYDREPLSGSGQRL